MDILNVEQRRAAQAVVDGHNIAILGQVCLNTDMSQNALKMSVWKTEMNYKPSSNASVLDVTHLNTGLRYGYLKGFQNRFLNMWRIYYNKILYLYTHLMSLF